MNSNNYIMPKQPIKSIMVKKNQLQPNNMDKKSYLDMELNSLEGFSGYQNNYGMVL